MKIIIAPDSFKNSIDAVSLCHEIETAIHVLNPDWEIEKIPVSDGGEGFLDAIAVSRRLEIISKIVTGPNGNKVMAEYGIRDSVAYFEMAQSSGLQLVSKLKPFTSTTFGLGELMSDAIDNGIRDFVIGIGGSATNDGGAGMAQALGFQFFDNDEQIINEKMNNELAGKVQNIVSPNLPELNIKVACDVKNPLLGKNGAVYTYAKQKGARSEDLPILEENLKNLSDCWKKNLNSSVIQIPGAGAAGGLGGGLMAFLTASLVSGSKFLLDLLDFDEKIKDADAIITGEGKIDSQTTQGKILSEIIQRAKRRMIPVYGICGILEKNYSSDVFRQVAQLSTFGNDSLKNPEKYIPLAISELNLRKK